MKTVSIISIVYGAFGLLWATMVTVMIRVQEAMMSNFPWPPEVHEIMDMPALLDSVYSIIGTIPICFPDRDPVYYLRDPSTYREISLQESGLCSRHP